MMTKTKLLCLATVITTFSLTGCVVFDDYDDDRPPPRHGPYHDGYRGYHKPPPPKARHHKPKPPPSVQHRPQSKPHAGAANHNRPKPSPGVGHHQPKPPSNVGHRPGKPSHKGDRPRQKRP